MRFRGRPFIGLNLYLDDGTVHWAGKNLTFKGTPFTAKVLSWGNIDRSIPYPPGEIQVNDAIVEVEDTNGQVRAFFDAITPIRRMGEIIFDFETNAEDESDVDFPILDFTSSLPTPTYAWKPLYSGEVATGGVTYGPGTATITLRDIFSIWRTRPIPRLLIRDNFPNMPDDVESAFSPIIFGHVASFSQTGLEKQGVILCPHIDKILNRYNVARHTCNSVLAVYRKKHLDSKFRLVSPAEYTPITQVKFINGIQYTFTHLQFAARQEEGTLIHADVSGINYRFDFTTGLTISGGEQRNPVDAITNLIIYLNQDEVDKERFHSDSFLETRNKCNTMGLLCDGAITENLNAAEGVTVGSALSKLCEDFDIDLFQTNHAEIALRIYEPASDTAIPINTDLVLKDSLHPDIPKKVFNRIRYRHYRQNSGLSEYRVSAATGQWGIEETLDHVADQDEMRNVTGLDGTVTPSRNPLVEEVHDLFFVRNDDVALFLMKRRMGYYTLRSNLVEFKLPLPEVYDYMQLATMISMTHYEGIGAPGTGWASKHMKVYGLNYDLKDYTLTVKAVERITIPDGSFASSWDGTHETVTVQLRFPQLPVTVNGTLDGPAQNPVAQPPVNLNDDYPEPPLVDDVSVKISYWTDYYIARGFAPTPAATKATAQVASNQFEFVNIQWQEDPNLVPRQISGYVPIPVVGGGVGTRVRYVTGTLYPDTRPLGLTDADIYNVIFYATDFNHEYFWVGTGESGTASGWMIKDEEPGDVRMRIYSPNPRGWALCDGTTGVRISDYKGDTSTRTVPNLTGNVMVMGASTYTGPVPTPAVAPTLTIVSAGAHTHPGSSVASHTHAVSGSTSSDAHNHTITDPGHTHDVTISDYYTDDDGSHDHGGSTASDGTHIHSTAAGPTESGGVDIDSGHHHTLGALSTGAPSPNTSGATDLSHDHSVSSLTGTISSASSEGDLAPEVGTSAADAGDSVSMAGGYTGSALGSHTHDLGSHTHSIATGSVTGNADPTHIVQWAINVYVGSEDSGHSHAINSTGSIHAHHITARLLVNGAGSKTTGITINNNSHSHTLSLTTGGTAPGLTIASDGAHTHSGSTVGADGVPKSMGLLPYLRT